DLDVSEDSLLAISNERVLALTLEEMRVLRDYFRDPAVQAERARVGLPADARLTDAELECLAQTWSEHCKHKIFNSRIAYDDGSGHVVEIDSLFKTYIKGSTERIRAERRARAGSYGAGTNATVSISADTQAGTTENDTKGTAEAGAASRSSGAEAGTAADAGVEAATDAGTVGEFAARAGAVNADAAGAESYGAGTAAANGVDASGADATASAETDAGGGDFCLSVFVDNAGVIRFNDDYSLVFKVETHNSPSALDPYGGALTGIVGVNRDPFGTGMGAKLIFNTDVFCFAPPDYDRPLPKRILHPRRIYEGVREGVEHGGNKSGIPTVNGCLVFDERFLGKPLVYCGTGGIMPARLHGKPSHIKEIVPGDLIVMTGGRIGKDGIHGATFSSEELHEGSPVTAVQIGDPITQKKMTDFLLKARDLGLYRCITDNGAGGLSSSVGETAQLSGGCEMDLRRAPLKYPGLNPWEILISESQERMTLAVDPERIDAFLALAARMDVEATVLGTYTDTGMFHVRYGDETVAYLRMDFLHNGLPQMRLRARWERPRRPEPDLPAPPPSPAAATAATTVTSGSGLMAAAEAATSLTASAPTTTPATASASVPATAAADPGATPSPEAAGDLAASMPAAATAEDIGAALPAGLAASSSPPTDLATASGAPADMGVALRRMLSRLNICSKESIVRQYDHEVQGGSVVKPLTGVVNDGPSDAAVIRPLLDTFEGIVVANGICPRYSDIDAYHMAACAIDEAVRNAVAVGADLDHLAGLDNFCWCDPVASEKTPDGEYKLAQLVRANQAVYDYTTAYGVPCISGKDSMKNDYSIEGTKISIPPTLLFSVIGRMADVRRAVTMDAKRAGDIVYVLGETKNELGASEWYALHGFVGDNCPRVEAAAAKRLYAALQRAIAAGLVASCHDCSDGGLGVALAETAFAGGLGMEVDLRRVPRRDLDRDDYLLFSETASRFVVTVTPANQAEFERTMAETKMTRSAGASPASPATDSRGQDQWPKPPPVILAAVGIVTAAPSLTIRGLGGDIILREPLGELKAAWQRPLPQ
ncbi:MAG: AIR synthase-related protein, partial [Pseudomonadota bacterium]|nr:AIR synthase-related protein [Pseudomonadota bacterium]